MNVTESLILEKNNYIGIVSELSPNCVLISEGRVLNALHRSAFRFALANIGFFSIFRGSFRFLCSAVTISFSESMDHGPQELSGGPAVIRPLSRELGREKELSVPVRVPTKAALAGFVNKCEAHRCSRDDVMRK
jgi:hypothetical protein